MSKEVITFGCRLNTYESEIIKQNLDVANLSNVIVFNTCAVTKEAEKKAVQAIRKARRENPSRKIIVTGCAAQIKPELFGNMAEVDQILGNEEKLHAKNYIDSNSVVVNDIMQVTEIAGHLVTKFDGKTRAFVQIQNGCNHRCTFCTIPFGRGNSRSVAIGEIVKQIQVLLDQGFKEIVFTGVDMTAYGADLPGNPTLAQMIRRVLSLLPKLQRLRLSSIDVAEIDSDLFNLMAFEKRLMPHFHISLQAGDNMILKRMKRRHTREQVIEFCNELRNKREEVSFGADIIAGFPTENDEMFDNTKNLIKEASIQYLHVFPFSARENTPASRMPQVKKEVIKLRASILKDAGQIELEKFYNNSIGKVAKVLVEEGNKGHSENFLPIKLDENSHAGDIVNAKIYKMHQRELLASIVR